jgi:hypothetical protein
MEDSEQSTLSKEHADYLCSAFMIDAVREPPRSGTGFNQTEEALENGGEEINQSTRHQS